MDVFGRYHSSVCVIFCREPANTLWKLGPNLDWTEETCEQQTAADCRVRKTTGFPVSLSEYPCYTVA